jgi:hypothetical protein
MNMLLLKNNIFFFATLSLLFISCGSNTEENKMFGFNQRESEGEELFNTHCITCHSLRYIEMQPAFPRKTWEKITDKMIKSFGAPIDDSSAVKIVDYLMSIKGAKK